MSKQRMKLHMKVLGQTGVSPAQQKLREDKPAYKEKFVPPEVSVLSYLMTKVIHVIYIPLVSNNSVQTKENASKCATGFFFAALSQPK